MPDEIQHLVSINIEEKSNKWVRHATSLLINRFVNQKPAMMKLLFDSVDTSDIKTQPKGTVDANRPAKVKATFKSESTADEKSSAAAKQQAHLLKMHEAMNKKFYELTEAGKLKTWPPGKGEVSKSETPIDAEADAVLAAKDCEVVHVLPNNLNRMLEFKLLNGKKPQNNSISKHAILKQAQFDQIIMIDYPSSYLMDVIESQQITLLFLIHNFCELVSAKDLNITSAILSKLYAFLELLKSCNCELPQYTYEKIESMLVKAIQLLDKSDFQFSYLFQAMVELLLGLEGADTSSLALLLMSRESTTREEDSMQKLDSMMISHLLSKVLSEDQRLVLKKLLLKQVKVG